MLEKKSTQNKIPCTKCGYFLYNYKLMFNKVGVAESRGVTNRPLAKNRLARFVAKDIIRERLSLKQGRENSLNQLICSVRNNS